MLLRLYFIPLLPPPGLLPSFRRRRRLLMPAVPFHCPSLCSAELPPTSCAVEPQELAWLASALFNVGVDLHGSQQYAAAVPALHAALAAAAVGLRALAEADSPSQVRRRRLLLSSVLAGLSARWWLHRLKALPLTAACPPPSLFC